ncbi:DHH family phosphoesterase [Faecalicatena contorta]|uniref:DHH family phosphoesterase n=1 Tax=Clostridia TaxID=186801 RepID=UPI00051B8D8A|nr:MULTISPECIES: DHH family phosphoesterase [Clostridia]MBM6684783.1 DHH family phosphoesterase [Faecalicatena contorta]MBM6710034.1 DHH family phosphoesterase [Faecalicatena contorta]HIX98224.1 DHH family phosphoesterase [Candidatus Dorea intestinigallinarum]
MKKKAKQNVRLKGQLKLYMQWPAFMTILLIAMNVWIYRLDRKAGLLMLIFVLIYIVIVGVMYFYNKSLVMKDLVDFAAQYGIIQNTLLKKLAVPYALLLEDGRLMWMNDQFREILGSKLKGEAVLSRYIPELNRSIFPKEEDQIVEMEVYYHDKEYRAELRKVSVEGFSDSERLLDMPEEKEYFIAVYLSDVTELNTALRQNEEQRLVAGLIYIDNYDEMIDSVEEVRQSLLVALIDRKINQYIARLDGIVKKMETDKYFIVMKKSCFKELEADRFSLLEDVKAINIGNSIPATLSIGLGLSKNAYVQSYTYARAAIDLALARGGDQAVIKDCNGITYYGGKREQTSKNTRVKARVKAEALREFITVNDTILVMGHRMTDMDSFGAAIGIYRAAAALEKKAHIVINDVSATIRPLYEEFVEHPSYPEDMFVTSGEAKEMIDDTSMVIVVDTNRPGMTECPELLGMTRTIVVFDHHRQSSDNIDNALLSYIEPYASSACEMVSEVLQYITDDVKIPAVEANSLYAGIVIDTNNFMNKTGVRTFEAAAFLRRCGADIPFVRKMLRDDMKSYQAKAGIISSAEVYRDRFAIARGENLHIESPTIIGAQAANELLDIDGIKATFVLTVYNGRIYVSARSIDEVNVQVIMEKLGGGGHMNASGAQFDHTNMDEAVTSLKRVIDQMIEKGDL